MISLQEFDYDMGEVPKRSRPNKALAVTSLHCFYQENLQNKKTTTKNSSQEHLIKQMEKDMHT